MARLLTQTTDYEVSWEDIREHKTNGEISEAIEFVIADGLGNMDELVEEIVKAIGKGELPLLEEALLENFEGDEYLESKCDKTRNKSNTQEHD